MAERVQYPYDCQNFGCPKGHLSTFYSAPPEWFIQKGLSTPRGCDDCRKWIKEQVDSARNCVGCGWSIRRSAKAKISYHKRIGVYEVAEYCNRCIDGDKPPERQRAQKAHLDEIEELDPPEILMVSSYDELSSYRKIHLGKHIVDHPFSEVGTIRDNGRPVSATSLVGPFATTFDLYNACSDIAGRTDDVYQYNSGSTIVKVTMINDTHVELTVFKPLGDGIYEITTSHDEVSIPELQALLDRRRAT